MAIAGTFNTRIDRNSEYVFDWEFLNDDESPMDVSAWQFEFILRNSVGATIWDVVNADFTRPTGSRIRFVKTISNVQAVPDGSYTISLLVTNSTSTNDEFVNGTYQFAS